MMLLLLWMKIRIFFSSIKALNKPLHIRLPKSLAILLLPDLSAIHRAHIHKYSTSQIPRGKWASGWKYPGTLAVLLTQSSGGVLENGF